jgi:predicted dehydrogenase
MASAARDGKIALITNWPTAWSPVYQRMKEVVDAGRIGKIIEFKCRVGHSGPLGMGAKHKGVSQSADAMTDEEKVRTILRTVKNLCNESYLT